MKEYQSKFFNELTTTELYEIMKVRSQVFHLEQNIHYLDHDDVDYDALHCFIKEDDHIIAYLRAYYTIDEVKIGRVLTVKRGQGLGKELMIKSIESIKEKMHTNIIKLDAQKHAEGFYTKLGFITTSEIYLEEGIEHVDMELKIHG